MDIDYTTVPFKCAGIEFEVPNTPTWWSDGKPSYPGKAVFMIQRAILIRLIESGAVHHESFAAMRRHIGSRAKNLSGWLNARPETISNWEHGRADVPLLAWVVLAALFMEHIGQPVPVAVILAAASEPAPNPGKITLRVFEGSWEEESRKADRMPRVSLDELLTQQRRLVSLGRNLRLHSSGYPEQRYFITEGPGNAEIASADTPTAAVDRVLAAS